MLLNCGVGEDSWESLGLQGRSNQSILKEINPKYSLEGLMLKLKLQYSSHLIRRADLLKETMMLGKIEGRRRVGDRGWDGGWHHWLNGHEFEQASGDGEGQGSLACCSPWGHKELDTTEQLNSNNMRFQGGPSAVLHGKEVPSTVPSLWLNSVHNWHAFLHSIHYLT